jgi:hypothetical protein
VRGKKAVELILTLNKNEPIKITLKQIVIVNFNLKSTS